MPIGRRHAITLLTMLAGGLLPMQTLAAVSLQPDPAPIGLRGQQLGVRAVPGELRFAAVRVWSWTEPDGTIRLLLDRGVRGTIGTSRVAASVGVVWLGSDPDGVPGRWRVFGVFEDLNMSTAGAAISVTADRLPIEGIVDLVGTIELSADVAVQGKPTDPAMLDAIARAEIAFLERFAGLEPNPDQGIAKGRRSLPDPARGPTTAPPGGRLSDDIGRVARGVDDPANQPPPVDRRDAPDALFRREGVFFFSAGDRITIQRGDESNSAIITGGVVVQYSEPSTGRMLELTAERAVVHLKPGPLKDQLGRLSSDEIEGIYLEGEVVASDGTYTVRGPRVYYDVASSRALILDAVFWTYTQRTGMPLYMRAEAIRQESANQFSADKARLSNTSFFNPHFWLGVSDVTISVNKQSPAGDDAGGRVIVDANNITLRTGKVPLLWLPGYKGDPEQFPLRNIGFENSNRTGAAIRTTWNGFTLLGMTAPDWLDLDLQLDVHNERGFAIGADLTWNRPSNRGSITGYLVPDDRGTDLATNGTTIDRDGEVRGMLRLEEQWAFAENWKLLAEGSYVSDELFVTSYFPRSAQIEREFTNRLMLHWQDGNSAAYIQGQASANDFIVSESLLQSPGYAVDKLPEARFTQVSSDLLAATHPGLLTHTWEASYAHLRIHFSEVNADELGFGRPSASQLAFGTDPDESLGDKFRAMGLNEQFVNRFDTRHELTLTLSAGPVKITPFVVGRITYYDRTFDEFAGHAVDNTRFWGGGGVTLATSIHRVNDSVQSRVLDLNRMRHIVEPAVTIWAAETTVDNGDTPIFDDDIDSLLAGTVVRAALNQTWQTKRGGPGRWRSVDVLRLDTEYVYTSDEAGREGPIPRYFAARPELSNPGEHARVAAVWQVSEVVAVAGETIWDFDLGDHARWSGGVLVRHTPEFSTRGELRFLDAQDVTYGTLGATYTLTDKYSAVVDANYDFDRNTFRNFRMDVLRAYPNFTLGISLDYDNIRDETNFGFIIRPMGLSRGVSSRSGSRGLFGG